MRLSLPAAALILAVVTAPVAARAQSTNDQRPQANDQRPTPNDHPWSPFFGCWTPGRVVTGTRSVQRCVLPGAEDREATFATYNGDTLVVEETMIVNGLPQVMQDKDCMGQRTVRWSQDGARFFYRTTSTCAGAPRPSTSGIAALVAPDQWLDVQSATAARREQVRVVRYWRAAPPPPAPIADAIRALDKPMAMSLSPTSVDDVIEASREVTPGAVEAWLAESGARIPLDRRTLIRLDDGHVHPRVIDLLVARAYPKQFEVRAGGSNSSSSVGSLFVSDPWFDPSSSPDFYAMEYGRFGAPFYYGWGAFYRPYDAIDEGGGAGGGDVAGSDAHGQVVNGQGYTRVQPRAPAGASVNRGQGGSGSAAGADTASGGGSGGDSSGGGSSSGASPAGYSGGGTSTGLTAVPR